MLRLDLKLLLDLKGLKLDFRVEEEEPPNPKIKIHYDYQKMKCLILERDSSMTIVIPFWDSNFLIF